MDIDQSTRTSPGQQAVVSNQPPKHSLDLGQSSNLGTGLPTNEPYPPPTNYSASAPSATATSPADMPYNSAAYNNPTSTSAFEAAAPLSNAYGSNALGQNIDPATNTNTAASDIPPTTTAGRLSKSGIKPYGPNATGFNAAPAPYSANPADPTVAIPPTNAAYDPKANTVTNVPGATVNTGHRDYFMVFVWIALWVCALIVWAMSVSAGYYYAPSRAFLLFTAITTWIFSWVFIPYYYFADMQNSLMNSMSRLRPLTRLSLEMFPLLIYLVFWAASAAIAGGQACQHADAKFYYCNSNGAIFAFTFFSLLLWIILTFWFTFKLLRNSAAYL